jgi:acetyl esterase/lipase
LLRPALTRLLAYLARFIAIFLLLAPGARLAGAVEDTCFSDTFTSASRDGRELKLDRIVDEAAAPAEKRPVLIFSFGGGWQMGERNGRTSIKFFRFIASLGYTVVTIDYRLGIREAKRKKEFRWADSREHYQRAIEWGVEDLYEATAFVLKHADAWKIDPARIVLAGSSAGAFNSLHAEHGLCNATPLAAKHLPADFRYAGLISMAGAIWLPGEQTPLEWKRLPCPILFFHGSKDQLVTYDEAHKGFSGYGSASIHRQLARLGGSSWFIDVPGADHAMAGWPLFAYQPEIREFLTQSLPASQPFVKHTVEKDSTRKTGAGLLLRFAADLAAPPPMPRARAAGEEAGEKK